MFRRIFKRWASPPVLVHASTLDEAELLNHALDLAMAFGEHWGDGTQSRMRAKFCGLTARQLDTFDERARRALNTGLSFIADALGAATEAVKRVDPLELQRAMKAHVRTEAPWVDEKNLGRIYSQALYYGMKDGLDHCLRSASED